jgi:hypothetical protein
MVRVSLFCLLVCLLIGGCSTDRRLRSNHDDVVQTARVVAASEAGVPVDQVVVSEFVENGVGRRTCLRTKYMKYSDLEVNVVTNPKSGDARPELEAKVTTDKILYTRHNDWEERIVEQVERLTPKTEAVAPVVAVEQGEAVAPKSAREAVSENVENTPLTATQAESVKQREVVAVPVETDAAVSLRRQADASFKAGIKAWDEAQRTNVSATQRKDFLESAEKNLEETVRLYAELRKSGQGADLDERISSANLVLYAVRKTKILE